MFTHLHLHLRKLFLISGLALAALVANLMLGNAKSFSQIDWLDVVGEGGSAMAVAVWMLLVLGSRPAGRVTNWLTLGMGFMFLAMWQDSLDEFIKIPAGQMWGNWLESGAMPIGIALLTYGLVHWHREQIAINQQLLKRERLFREHRFVDHLTHLGRASYLRQQLQTCLNSSQVGTTQLVMLDLDNFSGFNRVNGVREGDYLLHEVSELLLLNLRAQDLICRYAADRFAILLPYTDVETGQRLASELELAVQSFAYKNKQTGETHYLSTGTGIACWLGESAEELISRANRVLEQHKYQRGLRVMGA